MGTSTEQQPWGRSEGQAKARPSVGWLVQTGGLLRCTTDLGVARQTGRVSGAASLAPQSHHAAAGRQRGTRAANLVARNTRGCPQGEACAGTA